jgi:predicted metalloprotease with PDZ domain
MLVMLAGPAPCASPPVEPVRFTVRFPAPDKHVAEVEASYPTDGRAAIELMMPIWTPGFYRVESYADRIHDLSAKSPDGVVLKVEQPRKNRWTVQTGGAGRVVVSYKLTCESRSVTTNWVGEDLAVLNGAATFLTLVESGKRPHDVQLILPASWKQSVTGLDAAPGGGANHYRAADFDTLVDSPIVAGNPEIHEFDVEGSKHVVANAGAFTGWDGKRAAADLEKLVREHRRMWGFLPFRRYVFLCVFRRGGGGLEHANSTLLTCNASGMRTPASYLSWLDFVSHEYFHAFNAKRLRPIELGPFDYEKEPRTTGLWMAEGVTVYYEGLLTTRSGLATAQDFLTRLSGSIDRLQKTPGRLKQTLEQASLDVWTSSFSGIGGSDKTVSYYVKGPVVAFLLDTRVRRQTGGARSLDDVMRLAYDRYSGAKGFTAEQFRKTAEEVAGVDLRGWFEKAVASTEELDYAEALDWYGLRFALGAGGAKTWRLEVRDDATALQRGRLRAWLASAGPVKPASVEQTEPGKGPAAELVTSFDGLGEGFRGPQGTAALRNPSDNSLAVGPDHIVQTVNSRMAVFTKKGKKFATTGEVLYGPANTGTVFKGFGDFGDLNSGDAVVRYDQLADRWVIVLPIFRRLPFPKNDLPGKGGGPIQVSRRGVDGQPGPARELYRPTAEEAGRRGGRRPATPPGKGSFAIAYAISTGPDPLGSYYRYLFERPLFPDYPRLAVWPDGYYVTTSTGDDVIQKHVYVAERAKMLKGDDATEQGFVLDDVNFLLPADLDGKRLPPAGAPALVLAAGGTQLKKVLKDDGIYWWTFAVDWQDPSRSKLAGPTKVPVAPYEYLGGGQLTKTVPQPGTAQKLDVQGDKLMARLVYRRLDDCESLVAAHSVKTAAGGGVRWYEFRLDGGRAVRLHQQGTYAPEDSYRWMPSPALDGQGNLGIGYSFGGPRDYPGQRFAGRLSDDPPGLLTTREAVLAEGGASQSSTYRWQDYTQTAIDPDDDRTIWYVGDYLKKGATGYSTRIGAFRLVGPDRPH